MLHIGWLRDHMHHSDTFAAWLHAQFAYEFAAQPLAGWQQVFAQGQADGQWACLVALEDDELLGGAALAANDLPERPDIGPWLACVYVSPLARECGLAARLIEGVCAEATRQGHTRLYLHTHDRAAYYAKRGWQVVAPFKAWGEQHWLMTRGL